MRPIEDIISEKAYSELTEKELLEVAELAANEEEYNQMKRFFESFASEVQTGYAFQASPAVKESLDSIFMAKHPVIANDWNKETVVAEVPVIPLYRRRSVQIAAILLLCLSSAPLLFKQENTFDLNKKHESSLAQNKATNKASGTSDQANTNTSSDLPVGVQTNDNQNTLTANANNPSDLKDVEVSKAISATSFDFSAPAASSAEERVTINDGLSADLDPNIFAGNVSPGGKNNYRAATSEASGSDMLDWIQAAY